MNQPTSLSPIDPSAQARLQRHPVLQQAYDLYLDWSRESSVPPPLERVVEHGLVGPLETATLKQVNEATGRILLLDAGRAICAVAGRNSLRNCWLDEIVSDDVAPVLQNGIRGALASRRIDFTAGTVTLSQGLPIDYVRMLMPLAAPDGRTLTGIAVFAFLEPREVTWIA